MSVRIAVVYYSSGGHVHKLASALQEGAEGAGAEVRLRRAQELAPESAIRQNQAWLEHHEATRDVVAEVATEDLEWAQGFAFGTPTRYGLPSAQLKQFLDQCGPLWVAGELKNKPVTSFVSSQNLHGGQESTILSLNNVFYHWGAIIIPPDSTDPVVMAAGGNPYGTSYPSGYPETEDGGAVPDAYLAAARLQGERLATITAKLAG